MNNNKCFSWISAASAFHSLWVTAHSCLPRMPSNTGLMSGPTVGIAQTNLPLFLPAISTATRTSVFLCVCDSSHCPFVYSIDTVFLIDHVALICTWYSWWKGFWSASSATLPLGFSCGCIPTSACGSSTGVCSWDSPGRLRSALVRAGCGGGTVAWVKGPSWCQVRRDAGGLKRRS